MLFGCLVTPNVVECISWLLTANVLESMVLMFNNVGDACALELAVALRQNDTLEILDLQDNKIGSDGASALADALVANRTLKDLDLLYNPIGDDGATSIAEMLTRNESIERVCIGGFRKKGLSAFVTCLSRMSGVRVSLSDYYVTGFTSEIGNALVEALELNTTLETFNFASSPPLSEVIICQVNRLLALNRGGRRLLSTTARAYRRSITGLVS